ncbi:MAG: FtsX-like permease family protein [Anaerolineales bacterium]|uniref:FtsX-like permease family protein n=1 Tax=Candidatus Desulfolinea nitratireducens TaxID=2841698 RepID=A0A8J6NP68_9CHLR|nr:FtsX-like permease family protein [Candidatus Desulfolinea nitratireducens]MBL6960094.1 FtsX-like permease family protein [Anaerolineales bacterium]
MKNPQLKPNLLKPRWSKVFTDLWDDKTRTILVVASIAVGVFAIGMVISAYFIMDEDISHSYASVNPPNIEIWADPFDEDFVRSLRKVDGVEDVVAHRVFDVRASIGEENPQNLKLFGLSSFPGEINLLTAIEGSEIPGDNEIIISQDLMHTTGFHPGDVIKVIFPDEKTRELTMVGLVTDQTTSKPSPDPMVYAYVTMNTIHSFGLGDSFNHLYITVTGDGTNSEFITEVGDAVEEKIERSRREIYNRDEGLSNEHPMSDSTLAIIGLLGALGGLLTILSSSLIINTLNALMTQQLRQIGVMKLVGGRSKQILGMYLSLIVFYSLIALIFAVPLGAVAGYGLSWLITSILGAVLQGFRFVPEAVITQVVIAFAVPLSAGFFPVRSGARTSVRRAISDYRPGTRSKARSLLNFKPKRISSISRPILLSFRNTFRKKGRLLLTIFTLTVAGGVFIAVFNVRDSMGNLMDQLMDHFLGDVTVTFQQPYRVSEVKQALLDIPGVEAVEGWAGAIGEILDENGEVVTDLSISAPPQNTQLLTPEFVAGRWLLPNEEKKLVLSDTIYNFFPNLKPGDMLKVKLAGQREEEWQVVGIFRFVDMLGDPLGYANFEFIARKTGLPEQALSYRVVTATHDADAQIELTERIDRQLMMRDLNVQSVLSGSALRENASIGMNMLVIFLLIMAILTAFVGSIGLTGTMSINVLERTREIGVMRTIGAVDKVIMQSVIIEGLVIGMITWVLAIGISFPISTVLLTIIGETMMGSAMAAQFTPLGIFLWLGIVIVLSIIASIMPARNAAKLTINEVLAYE